MSPLVKHLLQKRKKAMTTSDEESIFRLQNQINTNSRKPTECSPMWNNVNNITGRKRENTPISSLIKQDEIHAYFQNITVSNYSAPSLFEIPQGTRSLSFLPVWFTIS
jgi:hypothetical protein